MRLLAQLCERHAQLSIVMQLSRMNLIEHRHATEVVGTFDKSPDQARSSRCRADRIAQCYPGATANAVHHERRAFIIEQQRLIAQPEKEWQGFRLCINDSIGFGTVSYT